jgi:hypothetical protein
MVVRHPHKLIYATKATEDVYNEETGEWIPGQPGADVILNCRATPSGQSKAGRKKMGKDGQLTEYSYDLGFEYDENFNIPQNAMVRIIGINDQVIFQGELGGYQIGNESISGWI